MIELKSSSAKANRLLVKKVYETLKDYNGKYVVVSFNPNLLRKYKKLDKGVFTGRIGTNNVEGFFKKLVVSDFIFSWYGKPDFISFDVYNRRRYYCANNLFPFGNYPRSSFRLLP